MTQTTTQKPQVQPPKQDELILVVKRSELFKTTSAWHGLNNQNMDSFLNTVSEKKEFLPRSLMEQDPTYKQIIPYLVFKHDNKYFLMQRQSTSSEQRLKSKFSLGIGGHIRQEDITDNSIFNWARREFDEEVTYKGNLEIKTLGILNDDSNDVGKVHIGLVLLLNGDNSNISVKSELKSGELKTYTECKNMIESLESWSQLILPELIS